MSRVEVVAFQTSASSLASATHRSRQRNSTCDRWAEHLAHWMNRASVMGRTWIVWSATLGLPSDVVLNDSRLGTEIYQKEFRTHP